MSELKAIEHGSQPVTRERIITDLRRLGVSQGLVLLVHSSLSAIGWVNGGPVTVIQALMDVLTPNGTLVMPTHSAGYSDPALWENPPVPEAWHETIRQTMPLFDPQCTPTRQMGQIPELFRTWPQVLRSVHPQMSFAAWGKEAHFVTEGHELAYSLGEKSPLARIYDLGGKVLLLGVGYNRNTSFHLAENRLPNPSRVTSSAPLVENGRRVWKEFPDIDLNADSFSKIGQTFEQTYEIDIGNIGAAESRLFDQRTAVDFAEKWLASSII